jgi:phage repressor protein C with HTH and peptisase S24 domain
MICDVMPRLAIGHVVVRGRSMEPTLRDGDRLLVVPRGRARAGRVAVVRLPGGRPLSVKRLAFAAEDGWWVERDNPAEGVDSWLVGAIPEADVVAIAWVRYWPPRRIGYVRRRAPVPPS